MGSAVSYLVLFGPVNGKEHLSVFLSSGSAVDDGIAISR